MGWQLRGMALCIISFPYTAVERADLKTQFAVATGFPNVIVASTFSIAPMEEKVNPDAERAISLRS